MNQSEVSMEEKEVKTLVVETKAIDKPTGDEETSQLLAQGKRSLLCSEIAQAVQQFEQACSILVGKYGEMANELGDAYYLYGKALLELSRTEAGVIGDAVPVEDGSADEEEEEEEGESAEVKEGDGGKETKRSTSVGVSLEAVEAPERNPDVRSEESEEPEASDISKSEAVRDETSAIDETSAGDETSEIEASASKSEEEQDQADDGEVTSLQLAWETLELAKVIYSRHDSKEMKLKLAETYLKLGEVGMEAEQFSQSIEDLNQSLSLLKSAVSSDDRLIAETLYELAVACQLDKRYDDAVRHLEEAVKVLESHVKLQRGILSGETETEEMRGLAQKEIDEISEIIPDIRAKIEDVIDERRGEARVQMMMDMFKLAAAGKGGASTAAGETTTAFGGGASTAFGGATTAVNRAVPAMGGVSFCQSSTSAVFSASNAFSTAAAADSSSAPVNNISHLMRKKRKVETENTETSEAVKRICPTILTNGSLTNGSLTNGGLTNGEQKGDTSAASVICTVNGTGSSNEISVDNGCDGSSKS